MKLSELSPETVAKIRSVRWDRIIENHEGPEGWDAVLAYDAVLDYYEPEFFVIDGHPVLLPIEQSDHPNLTILHTIFSGDGNVLTLFLKDTTYDDHWSAAGFMAVCEKVIGEDFFLTTLYHEWFIIERSPIFEA